MRKKQTVTIQQLIVSAFRSAFAGAVAILLVALFCQGGLSRALGAEVKEKAEAEGKVVLYASMGNEDCKIFADAFRSLYPKIDAQFYSAAWPMLAIR
jgi:hypothetical protein